MTTTAEQCLAGAPTTFVPQHQPVRQQIVVLTDAPAAGLRSTVLPMVARGGLVHLQTMSGGLSGLDALTRQWKQAAPFAGGPWYLVALGGNVANPALCAAAALPAERQPCAIFADEIILQHPFPALAVEPHPWRGRMVMLGTHPAEEAMRLQAIYPHLEMSGQAVPQF